MGRGAACRLKGYNPGVRDAVLVLTAGVAFAYGAYLEFAGVPWWLVGIGAACTLGATIWERRKRS
jgi:hypothetical protein